MDTYKCNYHMHSHYSDGALSPGQLVRKFAQEEYDVIALTDHGTINGIKEFLAACEAAGIKGIPGIEFNTEHVLEDLKCSVYLLGYNFDPDDDDLIKLCGELKGKTAEDRTDLSTEDAIKVISAAGGQAFLADPAKIEELGERDSDEYWKNLEILLKDLKKKGLKGLECITPGHSDEEEFRFVQLAGKYHLHISSGTDFHSDDLY